MKTKETNMNQYESSVGHSEKIQSGLTVKWSRTTGEGDDSWSVVCYSDDTRWLYDNGSEEELTLLGEVEDGLNKAEILKTSTNEIIALYSAGIEAFEDGEAWLDSLPDVDKAEASALLA